MNNLFFVRRPIGFCNELKIEVYNDEFEPYYKLPMGSIKYNIKDGLLYIYDFIVYKEQNRGKGIGTKLVQFLLDNVDTDLEYVVHCNDQSINIFKKLGFNEKEKYTILTK